jgi:hypothetical protein
MSLKRFVQVDVSYDLSVDDDESVTVEKLARVVPSPACSKNLRLLDVMKMHTKPATVSKCEANGVRSVMKVDDYFVDAKAGEVFSNVTDEWFT